MVEVQRVCFIKAATTPRQKSLFADKFRSLKSFPGIHLIVFEDCSTSSSELEQRKQDVIEALSNTSSGLESCWQGRVHFDFSVNVNMPPRQLIDQLRRNLPATFASSSDLPGETFRLPELPGIALDRGAAGSSALVIPHDFCSFVLPISEYQSLRLDDQELAINEEPFNSFLVARFFFDWDPGKLNVLLRRLRSSNSSILTSKAPTLSDAPSEDDDEEEALPGNPEDSFEVKLERWLLSLASRKDKLSECYNYCSNDAHIWYYYRKIKNEICLNTILAKLREGCYASNGSGLRKLKEDFRTFKSNCRRYNDPSEPLIGIVDSLYFEADNVIDSMVTPEEEGSPSTNRKRSKSNTNGDEASPTTDIVKVKEEEENRLDAAPPPLPPQRVMRNQQEAAMRALQEKVEYLSKKNEDLRFENNELQHHLNSVLATLTVDSTAEPIPSDTIETSSSAAAAAAGAVVPSTSSSGEEEERRRVMKGAGRTVDLGTSLFSGGADFMRRAAAAAALRDGSESSTETNRDRVVEKEEQATEKEKTGEEMTTTRQTATLSEFDHFEEPLHLEADTVPPQATAVNAERFDQEQPPAGPPEVIDVDAATLHDLLLLEGDEAPATSSSDLLSPGTGPSGGMFVQREDPGKNQPTTAPQNSRHKPKGRIFSTVPTLPRVQSWGRSTGKRDRASTLGSMKMEYSFSTDEPLKKKRRVVANQISHLMALGFSKLDANDAGNENSLYAYLKRALHHADISCVLVPSNELNVIVKDVERDHLQRLKDEGEDEIGISMEISREVSKVLMAKYLEEEEIEPSSVFAYSCTEQFLSLATVLNDCLGNDLPLNSIQSVSSRTHKDLMQKALPLEKRTKSFQIMCGEKRKFHKSDRESLTDELKALLGLNQIAEPTREVPVVLKPCSKSGSVGLHYCTSLEDLVDKVGNALPKVEGGLCVQEMLQGPEFQIGIVSRGKKHVVTDVYLSQRTPYEAPGLHYFGDIFIPNCDLSSCSFDVNRGSAARGTFLEKVQKAVLLAVELVEASGLECGASNCEIIVTRGGVDGAPPLAKVVEINARATGLKPYHAIIGLHHRTVYDEFAKMLSDSERTQWPDSEMLQSCTTTTPSGSVIVGYAIDDQQQNVGEHAVIIRRSSTRRSTTQLGYSIVQEMLQHVESDSAEVMAIYFFNTSHAGFAGSKNQIDGSIKRGDWYICRQAVMSLLTKEALPTLTFLDASFVDKHRAGTMDTVDLNEWHGAALLCGPKRQVQRDFETLLTLERTQFNPQYLRAIIRSVNQQYKLWRDETYKVGGNHIGRKISDRELLTFWRDAEIETEQQEIKKFILSENTISSGENVRALVPLYLQESTYNGFDEGMFLPADLSDSLRLYLFDPIVDPL